MEFYFLISIDLKTTFLSWDYIIEKIIEVEI